MAGPFDHHLAIVLPGDLRQFAECFQFRQLRFIVGIGDRAGAQSVAQAEADVVALHDFANVLEMGIEKTFLMMCQTPLGHDRAAAANNSARTIDRERDIGQPHARVDGEIIHTLLRLFDERVAINLPSQFLRLAAHFFQRLINGHRADGHR